MSQKWKIGTAHQWEAGAQPGFRTDASGGGGGRVMVTIHAGGPAASEFEAEAQAMTESRLRAEVKKLMEKPRERKELLALRQRRHEVEMILETLRRQIQDTEALAADPALIGEKDAGARLSQLDAETASLRLRVPRLEQMIADLHKQEAAAEASIKRGVLEQTEHFIQQLFAQLAQERAEELQAFVVESQTRWSNLAAKEQGMGLAADRPRMHAVAGAEYDRLVAELGGGVPAVAKKSEPPQQPSAAKAGDTPRRGAIAMGSSDAALAARAADGGAKAPELKPIGTAG